MTGRTYHATNRPPYELPANKTRTVLRTETHKGEGFNELRFEDLAGKEEIYIHGQKDLNVLIENDAAWHIKHDQHTDIDNERVTRIRKVLDKDGSPPNLGNDHLMVEGEKHDHIKVGGSFVKVDPSGIKLVGSAIKLNAGGSPGAGYGWAGQASVTPKGVVEVVKGPELVELVKAIPTEMAMEALLKEEKPIARGSFSGRGK